MKVNSSNIKLFFTKPEYFFASVAIFFGLGFLLLTPPLQGPDEQAHFIQAFRISNGQFGSGVYSSDQNTSYPQSLEKTYKLIFYGPNDVRFDGNHKYPLGLNKAALQIPLNEKDTFVNHGLLSGTAYAPVAYIPQAIAVFIGQLFNASPVLLIYMGRLSGLLSWILLIALAIKMLPVGKWVFVVVALIPMSLFQATVISADTIAFAFSLFFAALIAKIYTSPLLPNARDYIILGVVGGLLALAKPIFILLLPLMFLLLFKHQPHRLRLLTFLKITLILALAAIAVFISLKLVGGTGEDQVNIPQGVIPAIQTSHLVSKPGEFLFALWNTAFFHWGDGITRSFIGTFGWSDTPMALTVTVFGYLTVFISLVSNRGEDYRMLRTMVTPLTRFLLVLLAALFMLAVAITLYIYYTPVDYNIVLGIQGRYYLPVLVILFFAMINNNAFKLNKNTYSFFVKVAPCVLLCVSCVYVAIRYYSETII